MARVALAHVRKVYPSGHVALHDVTLDVGDGELVVLVGPSGSGKTTALRVLAGLERATAGTVQIGGRVVDGLPPKDRDVAMVGQDYALYPHLDVAGNLGFGLRRRGAPRREVDARVRQTAAALGLGGVLRRKPRALSGGQRQRVALGRALVREPAVFLFDEPLSNLDAALRAQARSEIVQLHRQTGAATVYVTHDQVEAMTMGDRVVVLDGGRVRQVGPPPALYDRPADTVVARLLGSPPMNLWAGDVRGGVFHASAGGLALDLSGRTSLPPEGPVVLGVRPEGVVPAGRAPAAGGPVSAPVEVTVERVEALGHEVVLSTRAPGATPVVARVAPSEAPEPGAAVLLAVRLDRLHLFDVATGRRLAS